MCRRIRANGNPVSVLMAYALEGAISGCHWEAVPSETKKWLRAEFSKMMLAGNKKSRRPSSGAER